jgi:hypothetical protein
VNCGFCGKPFEENRSQPACKQCPVGSGCGLVRCPHCGYENPSTPGWIAFLKKHLGRTPDPVDAGSSPARPGSLSLPVIQARN